MYYCLYYFQFIVIFFFQSMHNFDSIPQFLSTMLKQVSSSEAFKKFIKKNAEKMNFQKKNILNLNQEKVETLYRSLTTKMEHSHYDDQETKNLQNSIWLQNELRIFIYIMCAHLFSKRISIHELKQEDYFFLQDFFPNKRPEHLEYQVKLLLSNKNSKWSLEQAKLFRQIMKLNHSSKRWNYIAKELFLRSNKKYFKTPKQCRERWINHEDPSKVKGNWEKAEDRILLQSVLDFGKKWTLISRELKQTRTQNSVKNRYNSLIKMAKKIYGYEKSEQNLIDSLLDRRKLQQQKQQIQISAEIKVDYAPIQIQNQLYQQKNTQKNKKQPVPQIEEQCVEKQEKIEIQIKPQGIMPVLCSYSEINDFKYVFEQSQELQNIIWHSSESPFRLDEQFNEQFYMMNGNFCFDSDNAI